MKPGNFTGINAMTKKTPDCHGEAPDKIGEKITKGNGGVRKSGMSFTGAILALGGGATVAQGLTIITAPIVSRLFAPEAYGLAALFASIPAIIVGIGCLCYDQAILIPKRERDAANLFSLSIIILICLTLLTAIPSFMGRHIIARLLGAPGLARYLFLWPISFFLLAVAFPLKYWNTRQNQFRILAGVRIANSVAGKAIRIGGGLIGFRTGGNLIILNLINSLIIPGILTFQLLKSDVSYIVSRFSLRRMVALAKKYRKFPLFLSWSGLVDHLSSKIPVIILSIYFGTGVVGLYSLALALLQMPLEIVAGATGQVLFQRTASRHATGQSVSSLVIPIFRQLIILGLCPVGLLLLLGPQIFSFFLGPRWAGAGKYAAILAPWLLTILVGSPLSVLFVVFEKQRQFLSFNVSLCCSRIAILFLGGIIFRDSQLTIGGFSVVSLIFSIFMIHYLFKVVGISIREAARPIWPCFFYLLPFLGVTAFCRWGIQLPDLNLIIIGFGSAVIYFIIIFQRVEIFSAQIIQIFTRRQRRYWKDPDQREQGGKTI